MKIGKNKDHVNILLSICAFFGLQLVYINIVVPEFSYMGFLLEFESKKIIIGYLIFVLTLFTSLIIKDRFVYSIWYLIFILSFMGEVIFYQFSPQGNLIQLSSLVVILITLVISSWMEIKLKSKYRIINIDKFLMIVSTILILPFLLYLPYINISNLWLQNVYTTRALFRSLSIPIIGYINAPLARIILPVLIVRGIEKKRKFQVLYGASLILYLYLCGAVKSIFFGLIAVFIFYFGTYEEKIRRFLYVIIFFSYFGLIIYSFTKNIFLINVFIRRVIFTPAYLNSVYNSFFTDNFTFLTHSPLGFLFSDVVNLPKIDGALSFFVGEKVLGAEGLNANVGIFTEGYISFGIVGIIIFAIIIGIIISYFRFINIDPKFFGIYFVYIYYFNTSFLSTLFMTHGLLFLMVISPFILKNERNDVIQNDQ